MKCLECNNELTPKEKLISAIFGQAEHPLCQSCNNEGTNPSRCIECQEPTQITVNGKPYCPTHAGEYR